MKKPKTFRPWNPEQTLLLPPSPVEWLPEHHLVFFLLDMAAELDLSAIYAVYEARDPRGVKAYDPRMMVVLLLYAPHYQQSCPPCLIDPPGGPPMTDAIALRPGAAG
jgi:transposase